MKEIFQQLLMHIGEDPEREGLLKTPERAAKAFNYLTEGYRADLDQIVNGAMFEVSENVNNEMILVQDIELHSLCEHHLMPFIGRCHVAYLPSEKIIGLSKIPRIVDVFARRLQVQERLTEQVALTIAEFTHARGVAVVVEAMHMCMAMRGVSKANATMKTSYMTGEFQATPELRLEFLQMISPSR